MKNIIFIILALVIGVAEAWGQTALPDASATLVSGTIYTATTKTINGTLTVPTGGTVTIYIPAGVTLTINGTNAGNGYDGNIGDESPRKSHSHNSTCAGNGGKENACGGAGGNGAMPAICVPTGATLILTGEGTLIATGGNAGSGGNGGNGQDAHGSFIVNYYGGAGGAGAGGGGGAAAAIGGAGGHGGAGGKGGKYGANGFLGIIGPGSGGEGGDGISGTSGQAMGNVWIIGNVTVETTNGNGSTEAAQISNGTQGTSGAKVIGWIPALSGNMQFFGGNGGNFGYGGSAATYGIGGGGNGGDGGHGGHGGDIFRENQGTENESNKSQSYTPGSAGNGTLYVQQYTSINEPDITGTTHGTVNPITTDAQMPSAIATTFTIDGESTPLRSIFYGTVIEDMELTAAEKEVTRTGYTFNGYKIKGTSTAVYDANGIFVYPLTKVASSTDNTLYISLQAPEAITLEADWIPNTYTVTFDKQNGSGGDDSVTATYDSAMPSATAPTRTGYTFHGYFTEANGEGTKYYNADMSSAHIWDKANNTTTLYAHWTANSYTVTLDANGGTGGTTSVSATYDSAMPSATAPTRTGYTFTGYYYNDTQYYDGSMTSTHTWDRASATTLQAHWTINNYTLTYDVNDGNALSPDHKSVTYNTAYGELPTPTRTGYTFAGWYTQATGGTAVSSSTIMGAGDVTIHAHWTANIYTVQFDKQSGSGGTASVNATYDSAMPSAEAPSRTGYTFGGYYSEASGGGTQYYDADMSSTHNWDINTNPSTLYAKWTVKQYTVNLDKQSGTGGTSSVTVNYDSAMPSATAPSRTGYTFKGYYSEQNGGGTQYYAEDMNSAHNWDIDTNPSTLYAKWEANKCTINLDKQGGSGGTAYVTGTYDSAMPSATAPSRTGYTFAGYYTLPNGGGTQYYDENMVSVNYWNITTNPSTLYANWTANTYTLNFDVQNGDALSPSTQSVTYDAAYGTLPTPTRYGFAFKGWYTTPNGGSETDTEVLTSDIYSIDGDQTIYAHWNTIVVDIDAYSAETQLAGNYFRTFYDSQIAHILPTGVKAYKGKIEGNNLVLTAIEAKDDDDNDIIPKNVPVILRMMPNEEAGVPIPGDLYQIKIKQISLTTSESELTIDNTDNELIGSDIVIATAVANSYILSFGSNGLGFYEWSTHPLEAHKAYVIKDSANPAKALTFRFEDDVTGINDAIKDFMFNDSNMAIYNLNGIRLSKPQKGLNIINGRKVWVK